LKKNSEDLGGAIMPISTFKYNKNRWFDLMSSKTKILFRSLDRIVGAEGRSKLLAEESELYQLLRQVKEDIQQQYQIAPDRMDLHIEITKQRRDPDFRQKAEGLHAQHVDLEVKSNWGYMGRAFVLWTPTVEGYGKTHATVAFFGKYPRPSEDTLQEMAVERVRKRSQAS